MIQAEQLNDNSDIASLALDKAYLGIVEADGTVRLNAKLKGTITRPPAGRILHTGDRVAVVVKKVSFPATIGLEVIEGSYTVVEQRDMRFTGLTHEDIGRKIRAVCRIDDIQKTSGPIVYTLFDGSSRLRVAFFARGPRVSDEFKPGDIVHVEIMIQEHQGKLEAKLGDMHPATGEEKRAFDELMRRRTESVPSDFKFLVESDVLTRLKPAFLSCAAIIRRAIVEGRPILLRHHSDCDGYTGGIAIERAILSLLAEEHRGEQSMWRHYRRMPNRTPYYDYSDAIRDASFFLQDMKAGKPAPLLLFVDTGSGSENLLPFRKMKLYGVKIAVVDHHEPKKGRDGKYPHEYIDAFLNPNMAGGDSNITAGMLATELARLINPNVEHVNYLPALSGLGDKASGAEFEKYLAIAENAGLSHQFLLRLSWCVDFDAYHLGGSEARGIVEDLMGMDIEKLKKLVEILYPEIARLREDVLKRSLHYMEKSTTGVGDMIDFARINLFEIAMYGDYPAPGKVVGILFDHLQEKHPDRAVITLGVSDDFITVRASTNLVLSSDNNKPFNINRIIDSMITDLHWAGIDGGGHGNAGTIRFAKAAKDEVMRYLSDSFSQYSVTAKHH